MQGIGRRSTQLPEVARIMLQRATETKDLPHGLSLSKTLEAVKDKAAALFEEGEI